MRNRTRWLAVAGFVTLLAAVVVTVLWLLGFGGARPTTTTAPAELAPRQIAIPSGLSAVEIGRLLEMQGIVASDKDFLAEVRRQGVEAELKPGIYELTPGEDVGTVVRKLAKGEQSEEAKVTIPEGLSIDQVADRLGQTNTVSGEEYEQLARRPQDFGVPRVGGASVQVLDLEGLLFPSTYYAAPEQPAQALIAAQLQAFSDHTADLPWEKATALGVSPYEIVIIASMIEKETALPEERALVAAVIYNRIKQDMRLDIDATVRFALRKWTGALTQSDLRVDSPYNTRRYKGLPPGPIASPGVASLEAALQPAEVDYLYYVLTQNDGRHFFTASYEEFLEASEDVPQQ